MSARTLDPVPVPAGTFAADVVRALAELAAGRAVVVVDDHDRENEGDLIFAAEYATPGLVAFTVRHGSGLLCVPMPGERLDALDVPPMCPINQDPGGAAFAVSVDARDGVSTGISAADRARTIRLLAAPGTGPDQLTRPGHVLPLRARPGGVLERPGHTEAAVDLIGMAGLRPVGALCTIVNDDGTTARGADLERFCAEHGLHRLALADLVRYRRWQAPILAPDLMTTLVTQHRVRDFDAWRAVFAGHQENRRAHGATGHRIYRIGDDVTVLTEFPDRACVEEFLADPALREVIDRAGFIGGPVTRICELADSEEY